MSSILRGTAGLAARLIQRGVDGWSTFFFRPANALPLGVVRIGIGSLLVWNLLVLGLDLRDYLGSDGWIGPEAVAHYLAEHTPGAWSLWLWVPDRWLWPVWAICLGVAVSYTLGFYSRISAVLSWITMVSLARRMPVALFGFDLTLTNWLFYLAIFGASGDALSIDRLLAFRRRSASPARAGANSSENVWSATTIRANLALRMIQLHLVIIYGFAGLSKLSGPEWWNGTAMEMLVLTPEFRRFDLTWTLRYPTLLMFSTHAGLLLELSYPVVIWIGKWRWFVVASVALMHIDIDLMLGLREFGLTMIIANLSFLPLRLPRRWLETAKGPTALRSRIGHPPSSAGVRDSQSATSS